MSIIKLVITGGPCAGKSTAMSWIQNSFSGRGHTVLFVPETATELITGGVAPWTCGSAMEFQEYLMSLQLEKERLFEAAAAGMSAENVLLICDRGALDSRAYMTEEEHTAMLDKLKLNYVELRDSYDAVFHLVTAANGAESFYTTANNTARIETPEEARALDERIISAWTGHPHLRVIDNSTDFTGKMRRLISEIAGFLGEPEPYEIERKFLIERPDISALLANPNCRRVEIIQTYLKSEPDTETRIRQRGERGHYTYYKTTKRSVSAVKRVEVEKRLSQSEYVSLLMDADTDRRQIRKTRYCLMHKGQYFEIDIYPGWKDKAIAEIELHDEEQKIEFPEYIKVIREVTGDEEYRNFNMALADPA